MLYGFIIPDYLPQWVNYIIFLFCAIVGAIVGLIAGMWLNLGVFLVGAWVGGTIGVMIYNALLVQLFHSNEETAFWVVVLLCVLVCGFLAIKLIEHAIIVGTCICGPYAFIRGLSMFVGGYPNEILMYSEMQAGSFVSVRNARIIDLDAWYILRLCLCVRGAGGRRLLVPRKEAALWKEERRWRRER